MRRFNDVGNDAATETSADSDAWRTGFRAIADSNPMIADSGG
jgi:hypothetical protein